MKRALVYRVRAETRKQRLAVLDFRGNAMWIGISKAPSRAFHTPPQTNFMRTPGALGCKCTSATRRKFLIKYSL